MNFSSTVSDLLAQGVDEITELTSSTTDKPLNDTINEAIKKVIGTKDMVRNENLTFVIVN